MSHIDAVKRVKSTVAPVAALFAALVFLPQITGSYIALPGDKEAKNGCHTVEAAQQSREKPRDITFGDC